MGAQFRCQCRLFVAPSDGHYAVAQFVGVLHPEVAQAADSLHADQRVGSDVEIPQRVECGDAGAQKRGRFQRFQLIGDADQTGGAGVDDLGVPAVCRRARFGWFLQFTKSPRRHQSHVASCPPR